MKLLRDASWLAITLEPQVQDAFDLVVRITRPRVFWDVGANLGFYSWLLRQYSPIQRLLLFEPDPTNFALISKTIWRNKISDCLAMNLALSDVSGRASFLVDRASGATGSLGSVSNAKDPLSLQREYGLSETIITETATVDSLISRGLPAPDLMKIDVEGAEHLVLAGAEECLKQTRPTLILETANSRLLRQLRHKGYSVFRIDHGNFLCLYGESRAKLVSSGRAFELIDA